MRTVTIDKCVIMEALETEPLLGESGVFINSFTCAVCAVGSVLRACGVEHEQEADNFIYSHDFGAGDTSLGPDSQLAVMSRVYEGVLRMADEYSEPFTQTELRDFMLDWVDENIPEDYSEEVELEDIA